MSAVQFTKNEIKIAPIDEPLFPEDSMASKAIALGVLGLILVGIYTLVQRLNSLGATGLSIQNVQTILANTNVFNIAIGTLIAANSKELVKSVADNLVMPVLAPVAPFLNRDYLVQVGPFKFNVGDLFSDALTFVVSLYTIYLMLSLAGVGL